LDPWKGEAFHHGSLVESSSVVEQEIGQAVLLVALLRLGRTLEKRRERRERGVNTTISGDAINGI
jgi:hypothetical protein